MSYTDAEMIIASQIAYHDFDQDAFRSGNHTIRELLEMEGESGKELLAMINSLPGTSGCGDWKLMDVGNNQAITGMYACMLDTGDREALVAFRGSEKPFDENGFTEHAVKDWALSDFGLLNSTATPQQIAAQRYTEYLYQKYGDKYDSFGMTGHSLGGNLAESATVTASNGMKAKIKQCLSLDGPGFSEEYILAHRQQIQDCKGKLTHLQWSAIGTCLTPLPGSDYRTVNATTPTDQKTDVGNLFWRHNLPNLILDGGGSTTKGERDPLAQILSAFTKGLDSITGLPLLTILYPAIIPTTLSTSIPDSIRHWFALLWEDWHWKHNSAAANRHCDFSFDPVGVCASLESLSQYADQIGTIWQNVEAVCNSVPLSQFALWCQLKQQVRSIKNQQNKMNILAQKGNQCFERYLRTENALISSC